jgi:hypothetical protein
MQMIEMKNWLPNMDLNHDKQIQSLLCYRYTIRQSEHGKSKSFVQGVKLAVFGDPFLASALRFNVPRPLTRPSGTLSPCGFATGGEGWGEGAACLWAGQFEA